MKAQILIMLALLTALISSCDLCKNKQVGHLDLTDAQKSLIPYEKGQAISFLDSRGQIIDLAVVRSEQSWFRRDVDPDGCEYIMFRTKGATLESAPNNIQIIRSRGRPVRVSILIK